MKIKHYLLSTNLIFKPKDCCLSTTSLEFFLQKLPCFLIEAQRNTEEYSFDLIVSLSKKLDKNLIKRQKNIPLSSLSLGIEIEKKDLDIDRGTVEYYSVPLCFCARARGDRYKEIAKCTSTGTTCCALVQFMEHTLMIKVRWDELVFLSD